MLTRRKLQTTILLALGILIVLNFLGDEISLRLDFTADQRYTLSDATEDILKELEEPVTISAYFSDDLPPNVAKVRSDFRDLLVEYSDLSDGMIVYEFINPNVDEETEMQAQQAGISPLMINVRERDQVKQQRAYLGAVVKMADRMEPIPVIQPGAAMEYELSSSIKKVAAVNRPLLALIQGHGEPAPQAMQQAGEQLSVMYDVAPLNLNDTTAIASEFQAALWVAPQDSVPPFHFTMLDNYLAQGGRLLIAFNTVQGNMEIAEGERVGTGIEQWLATKGIEVQESYAIDVNSSSIMVTQTQGMMRFNTPVKFPYIPIITEFNEHPITEGLENVVMPFVSPITVAPRDTSIAIDVLATTSGKSGIRTLPLTFDINKRWTGQDFNQSQLPVAVAAEGPINGADTRMVVFSNGTFAVNQSQQGQQAQRLQPDNVSLLVNAVDWLADDTGLIQLRTKGVTSRPIDPELDEDDQFLIKYANFLIPLLLVLIYGIVHSQRRKSFREKSKSVNYE